MPLTDDAFNRCKSGVRVIDASAVAVPSIVGTVSDMAQMVIDQKTGFVIPKGGSWRAALETLARDPALVREMGQAARQSLIDNWTARTALPVVEQAVIDWVQKG
jgi:glycosyltransferase involved in cell wall biosynthesis